MQTRLMAAMLMMACVGDDGGEPDPHEPVVCDPEWGVPDSGTRCERQCAEWREQSGPACQADSGAMCFGTTVNEDGERGCCAPNAVQSNGQVLINWTVCPE